MLRGRCRTALLSETRPNDEMTAEPVCRETLTVQNENGLHMVPCSLIARAAKDFSGQVILTNGPRSADASTILELMSLNASCGTELEVEARGPGCDAVVAAIRALFDAGFPTDAQDE